MTKQALYEELFQYIELHYKEDLLYPILRLNAAPSASPEEDDDDLYCIYHIFKSDSAPSCGPLYNVVEAAEEEETFTEALLRLIEERRLTEPEVYNAVFMDRKLFNKIRNDRHYQPSKRTVLLLAIALKLSLEETKTFLDKAGFSLSRCNKTDVIVEYFLVNGNYDILTINEMLIEFKMSPLLRCD